MAREKQNGIKKSLRNAFIMPAFCERNMNLRRSTHVFPGYL